MANDLETYPGQREGRRMVESDDEEPEPVPLMSLKEKAAAAKKAKKAPNSSVASGANPSSQRPGATSSVPTRPNSSGGTTLLAC